MVRYLIKATIYDHGYTRTGYIANYARKKDIVHLTFEKGHARLFRNKEDASLFARDVFTCSYSMRNYSVIAWNM